MNRILASLSITALLAVPAVAQNCLGGLGTPILPTSTGDDTLFTPHYPLGFSFPVSGSALGSYTHCRINCNGWLILTDGTTTPAGTPSGYGSTTTIAGTVAGYAPVVAAFWKDMTIIAPAAVQMDVTTNPGVSAKIVWQGSREYSAGLPAKTYSAELFSSGVIQFTYSVGMNVVNASLGWVGVSRGNGQTAGAVSDLSAGAATAGFGCVYETFGSGLFDLGGQQLTIAPDGTGGWISVVSCISGPPALSTPVGTGCYAYPGTNNIIYEQWPAGTALASASAELTGNAMSLVAISGGYAATWVAGGATSGPTAYVPPGGGAVSLPTTDDGSTIVATSPINTPYGVFTSVTVSHNGIVTLGSTANSTSFTVSGATASGATHAGTGFYFWYDWNDAETGSGVIKAEEAGGVLYLTWDGVESYQFPAVADPSTFQFQINLANGSCNIVWSSIATVGQATRLCLAGFNGAGVSADPGSVTLSTALPIIHTKDVSPMALSVNVLPEITGGGSTVPMTWTVSNVPEASHILANLRACNIVFSIAPAFVAGIDLGFVNNPPFAGANGCRGYVFTADAFVDVTTLNATGVCTSIPFVFSPPPSLVGLVLTTQAIAIAPAGTYAGFANDIGGGNSLWTSNAVEQTYNLQ
jgi:hypothetical protein